MSSYKTHARSSRFSGQTMCGLLIRFTVKHGDRYLPLAKYLHQITCRNCLGAVYDPSRRAA